MEGIYFGEAEDFVNFIREKDSISVTYYPEINRFRGRESLQIIIRITVNITAWFVTAGKPGNTNVRA